MANPTPSPSPYSLPLSEQARWEAKHAAICVDKAAEAMADGREDDARAFAHYALEAAERASKLCRAANLILEVRADDWRAADHTGRESAPPLRKLARAAEIEAQSTRESAQAARRYAVAAKLSATPFSPLASEGGGGELEFHPES